MRNKNLEHRFAEIYKLHYPSIYLFIFRLIEDSEEAKDITQDSFLKLYRSIQKKEEPKNIKAWLFKVSANTCYTLLKRKERHRKIIENEAAHPAQQLHSVEDHLIKLEEIIMIRSALKQMALKDRIILELYQGGCSYQEIAHIINVKISTVGKKLFRARHKLAIEIKKTAKGNVKNCLKNHQKILPIMEAIKYD